MTRESRGRKLLGIAKTAKCRRRLSGSHPLLQSVLACPRVRLKSHNPESWPECDDSSSCKGCSLNLAHFPLDHCGRRLLVKDLRPVEPVVPTAVGRGCGGARSDILCVEKVSHLKIPGQLDGKRDFVEAVAGRSNHCKNLRFTFLEGMKLGNLRC
jgi:hypothetical protein